MKNNIASSIVLLLSLGVTPYSTTVLAADPYFQTTAEATVVAKRLGYTKTKELSYEQAVYQVTKASKIKGLKFISPDAFGHIGDAWKAASTIQNLGKKETRLGTYNEDLTIRMGD